MAHRQENGNQYRPVKFQRRISKNSSIRIPMQNEWRQHKNQVGEFFFRSYKCPLEFGRHLGRNSNSNSNLPLWRDVSSNNEQNSSPNLPLFYSFLTETKQSLATSYMSSKGHCCLCQFTAINNDLDVLIKHISYCHPRFTASLKVKSISGLQFNPIGWLFLTEKQRST